MVKRQNLEVQTSPLLTEDSMAYKTQIQVRFEHGDPGGISFFPNVYRFAHEAYENFVAHMGFSYKEWFGNKEWGLPIRHSEADYFRPLFCGKKYDVQVSIEKLGESSFTTMYEIKEGDNLHVVIRLVHTFFDIQKRAKMPMPSDIRTRLEPYQG